MLYAFSDFVHPGTNESIREHAVNGLQDGEAIEDRFEGDDYRLLVVANKFQTGFDQPLLAGMFLDKTDPRYIDPGAIFDIMAYTVIQQNLQTSAMP